MPKRKTEFPVEMMGPISAHTEATIKIIGRVPKHKPYVKISFTHAMTASSLHLRDADLEQFAVNLLKALGKWPKSAKKPVSTIENEMLKHPSFRSNSF